MRLSKDNTSILEEMRCLAKIKNEHEANAAKEQLIKMKDLLRNMADIIDELLILEERENKGEDVLSEGQMPLCKFLFTLIELLSLNKNNV